MVHGEKYINAEEIVKHKDGRIDLFNTILARKDKNSQIPVLAETKTASVSQPLPLLPSAPMPGKYRKLLPASAPSTIINKVDSSPVSDLKEAEGDTGTIASFSRKRLSSPPSPTTTPSSIGINTTVNSKISSSNDIGSSKDGSYARLRKVYKVTTTPIGEGHSHGYLDIFKGYVEQPSTVPAEIAYWHDHEHLIIKDAYPKSKVHMLVLPRQRIDKLDKLSSTSGITLIQRLKERAHWLVTR
ncbi:hypothetical protein BX616_005464 [Lobosporangium transversale]|nr:hypothetical protein BX616_005464 [Lobosporangium transversale]